MIKKIVLGLLAFVLLLVVGVAAVAFLSPTHYACEREIAINKPVDQVFAYVKILKNQNDWGPWLKKDPDTKLTNKGTDGTVGYTSIWDSQKEEVGAGEQEITKISEGERIDYELRFKRPFESTSNAYIVVSSVNDNQTKVKWGFSGDMPVPMNLMLLMMDMEKEIGKDFDSGLANLKEILEKE